ncbi:MAG: hypothetical protein ABIY55_28910 [Kofleriaceae bacterium]
MTRRSVAVRLVLVAATLTTVATSAPQNYYVTDTLDRPLARGTLRIHAAANQVGMSHADDLSMKLELHAVGTASTTVTITPDDPELAVEQVALDAQVTFREYDLIALCQPDRACDAGVTIEIPPDVALSITATGTLTAFGDPAFFFPEDRSFPADATLQLEGQP